MVGWRQFFPAKFFLDFDVSRRRRRKGNKIYHDPIFLNVKSKTKQNKKKKTCSSVSGMVLHN
jgi:hypothetical protein